jgi:excisionase family DNA binding protein
MTTPELSTGELRLLAWFVRVARQILPADHPAAKQTGVMLRRLDAHLGVARERNPKTALNGKWKHGTTISTSEAAALLGVTPRRVQQRIAAGEIPARRVGRTYIIDSEAITE